MKSYQFFGNVPAVRDNEARSGIVTVNRNRFMKHDGSLCIWWLKN